MSRSKKVDVPKLLKIVKRNKMKGNDVYETLKKSRELFDKIKYINNPKKT